MGQLTQTTMIALWVVAGVTAAVCWWAAWRNHRWAMALSKPLPMLALVAVALLLPWQGWVTVLVVVCLVCGLVGDVVLLDPPSGRRPGPYRLPAGLGAFLVGHVAYLGAMLAAPAVGSPFPWPALVAFPLAVAVAWCWGRPLLAGAGELRWPVAAYQAVILAMALAAAARGPWVLVAGAVLFVASDLLLGRSLFLAARRWSALAVMVTYHLAQLLLVIGLVGRAG